MQVKQAGRLAMATGLMMIGATAVMAGSAAAGTGSFSISPSSGPVGTTVTFTGSGCAPVPGAKYGFDGVALVFAGVGTTTGQSSGAASFNANADDSFSAAVLLHTNNFQPILPGLYQTVVDCEEDAAGVYHHTIVGPVFTVTKTDTPPNADSKTVSTGQDQPVDLKMTGSDVDGDPLSFRTTTSPAHGTLSSVDTATLRYTPAAGYVGSDSFDYVANDGSSDSLPETVSISVTAATDNAPPTANDDSFSVTTGVPFTGHLTAQDSDGTIVEWKLVAQDFATRTHAFIWAGDGTFTITAPSVGVVDFWFQVQDNKGALSDLALVTIDASKPGNPTLHARRGGPTIDLRATSGYQATLDGEFGSLAGGDTAAVGGDATALQSITEVCVLSDFTVTTKLAVATTIPLEWNGEVGPFTNEGDFQDWTLLSRSTPKIVNGVPDFSGRYQETVRITRCGPPARQHRALNISLDSPGEILSISHTTTAVAYSGNLEVGSVQAKSSGKTPSFKLNANKDKTIKL